MSEKPLHVLVAEALGCKTASPDEGVWFCTCKSGGGEHSQLNGMAPCVKYYDEDWSATGPLIEKYEITLTKERFSGWVAYLGYSRCEGETDFDAWSADDGEADAPLIAVCELLLKLDRAGKLEKELQPKP